MPNQIPTCEELVYRLVLISPDSRRVLAQHDGTGLILPRVRIPIWTRAAEELQKAVRVAWDLSIFILEFLKSPGELSPCVVAQLLSPVSRVGLTFVTADRIPAPELTDWERTNVEAICAGDTGDRGPLSRLGWIAEAMEWISEEVGREVKFTGKIEQTNAGGRFALVRLATQEGPDYWLKATGVPNLHEFGITAKLVEVCPDHLPTIVGMRNDWNAWVMEQAGLPLVQPVSLQFLERAVVAMADLQKSTQHHTRDLLTSGATDQRMTVIRAQVGKLVAYLEEAMEHQTSVRVPPLGVSRLREIGAILEDSCAAMQELNIPETVIHADMNSGNILIRESACVFTDWCEARVGNPFFTLEYLLLLLANGPNTELNRTYLKRAYKQRWLDSLTPWQIDRAFTLMPLLAIVSYLFGRGDWLRSTDRHDAGKLCYARSLARHMDREARFPALLEALCH